jgi:hypothetical protein
LEDQLAAYIRESLNGDIQNFYSRDGLFLFQSEEGKTRTYYKIKTFFDKPFEEAEAIFDKIAEIPFPFIITLTPDHLLQQRFEQKNLKYKTDFYWKNRTPSSGTRLPSRHNPLLYGMMGDLRERDSLVLTHDDLFDYFHSILGARSMPDELKKIISRTDNFIFLGVRFDQWYMQLLLRILAQYNEQNSFLRYASSLDVPEEVLSFCMEQFRITFVRLGMEDFVDALHRECGRLGLLKKAEAGGASELDAITSLISRAKTGEALDRFRNFLEEAGEPAEETLDELVLQSERLNRLNRKVARGTLSDQEAEAKRNRITESLLNLIRQSKRFE